jgi:hypothetical protein
MKNMGQGTHSTKLGAYSLAENTPNASKSFCPKCLPKPKSLMFSEKKSSLGVHSPWLGLFSAVDSQPAILVLCGLDHIVPSAKYFAQEVHSMRKKLPAISY